jgi:hypothetical protein
MRADLSPIALLSVFCAPHTWAMPHELGVRWLVQASEERLLRARALMDSVMETKPSSRKVCGDAGAILSG